MRRVSGWLVAVAALVGAPSFAQDDATEVTPQVMLEPVEDMGRFDVMLGGGVGTYMGQLSDFTGTGPTWGVTMAGDMTRGLGFELGYNGARTPITDERVGNDSGVWRNGVSAMAKISAPLEGGLRPFAGLGVGGAYLNVTDDAEGLYQNDWVTELPVAAGLEYRTRGGISAGARATYRFQAGEEFAAPAFAGESPEGGLLSAQLTIGGVF